MVEQKDKRFLKRNYGSSKGLLMKPSTFGLFRYFGDDWHEYEIGFVPKTEPTEEQKKRVMEFARLIHEADFDEFSKRYADYLDVDQFLRFSAATWWYVISTVFLADRRTTTFISSRNRTGFSFCLGTWIIRLEHFT